MTPTLTEALRARAYPGRVCVAARSQHGVPLLGYALTGRSERSRARALRVDAQGDIKIVDTSGEGDDALRHYTALARRNGWVVVGNGDQVVPIAEALAGRRSEREAWDEHSFEPDPPIWTPRIWMVARADASRVVLGWARRGRDGNTERGHVALDRLRPGHGLLLTTYDGTPNNVRTSAEPVEVTVQYQDVTDFGADIWAALHHTLRVGAFATTVDAQQPVIYSE